MGTRVERVPPGFRDSKRQSYLGEISPCIRGITPKAIFFRALRHLPGKTGQYLNDRTRWYECDHLPETPALPPTRGTKQDHAPVAPGFNPKPLWRTRLRRSQPRSAPARASLRAAGVRWPLLDAQPLPRRRGVAQGPGVHPTQPSAPPFRPRRGRVLVRGHLARLSRPGVPRPVYAASPRAGTEAMNLNPAIQTAEHAKYANEQGRQPASPPACGRNPAVSMSPSPSAYSAYSAVSIPSLQLKPKSKP